MIVLLVASASLAGAVTPTASPTAAFSATVFGRGVGIRDTAHVELVDVGQSDRERRVVVEPSADGRP